jgi:SAM-dependent methyltransferase
MTTPGPAARTSDGMGPDRSHETTPAGIPWSEFGRLRGRFTDRWPTVFHLPLVHDHFALARQHAGPVRSLLDVGATERVHEPNARATWPDVDYRSLDLDRTNRHDYHDFAAVDRQFDLLLLLEVLEHLEPRQAIEMVAQCRRRARPGGHLLVSVPNVFRPGVQQEWTHVAALPYQDLGALLHHGGFEVLHGARVYYGTRRSRLLHARLFHALHRFLGVDYAQSIVMLARAR